MNREYWSTWLKAAVIRSIKTCCQTALSMFTLGMALNEIQWEYVLSVSAVAGIYSIITSIAGLPEVERVGADHDNE